MNMLLILFPLGGILIFITVLVALARLGVAISNNPDEN